MLKKIKEVRTSDWNKRKESINLPLQKYVGIVFVNESTIKLLLENEFKPHRVSLCYDNDTFYELTNNFDNLMEISDIVCLVSNNTIMSIEFTP